MNIFKNQITTLFIKIDNNKEDFTEMLCSVANICDYIFTAFTRLVSFTLIEPPHGTTVRLNFDGPFRPNIRSSTLFKLSIRIQSFDDCVHILDGRFNQLHTLVVDLTNLNPPEEIPNQVSLKTKSCILLKNKTNFLSLE